MKLRKFISSMTAAAILIGIMFATPIETGIMKVSAAGTTIYVATNGNDSNNGSSSSPYRTIKKAADVARAGTTVLVRGGTYSENSIRPGGNGTENDMIVFKPASDTDVVIIKHPETFSSATSADKSSLLSRTGWSAAQTNHLSNSDAKYINEGDSNKLTPVFDLWGRSYIHVEGFRFQDYKYARSTIEISGAGNVIINNRFENIGTVARGMWHWTGSGPLRADVTVNINGNSNVIRNNYFQSIYGEVLCYNGGSRHNIITENTIINAIGKNGDHSGSDSSTLGGRFDGNLDNLFSFNYNGGTANGYSIWLDVDVRDFTALRNVAHNTAGLIFNESGCTRNWVYENIAFNKRRGTNNRMEDNAGNFNDFASQQMSTAYFTAFWDTGSTFDARWVNNVAYNVETGINIERSYRDETRNNIVYDDARNQLSQNNVYGIRVYEPALIGFGNNHPLGYQLRGGGPLIFRNNLCFSTRRNDYVSYMYPTGGRATVDNFKMMANSPYDLSVDPGFVNAQAFDFRLKDNSPAKGTGDNGVDRGAYAIYPKTDVGFNSNAPLTADINVRFGNLNSSLKPGTSVNLELRLSNPATKTMTFEVAPVAGDAREDLDFRFPNGKTVTFNTGERTKTINIEILAGNPQHTLDQLLALRVQPVNGSTTASEIGGRNLHLIKIKRVTEYTVTLHNTVTTQDGVTSIGRPVTTTHKPGDIVTISAGSRSGGFTFERWKDGYHVEKVNPASLTSETTTFTMPERNVTLQALWTPRWEIAPAGDSWDSSRIIPAAPVRVTGITGVQSTLALTVGNSSTLTATVQPSNASIGAVRWISSNPLVATVDTITGRVTAVSNGTATIRAKTIDNNREGNCTVTVTGGALAATLVSMTHSTIFLNIGGTHSLTASVLPSAANQGITWSSSNTSVATVDSSGRVTAVANGNAVITATSTANTTKSTKCTVVVGSGGITQPPTPTLGDSVAIADATLKGWNNWWNERVQNFGGDEYLMVLRPPEGAVPTTTGDYDAKISLLKFNIQDYDMSKIVSAKLVMTLYNSSASGTTRLEVGTAATDWQETTVTWDNNYSKANFANAKQSMPYALAPYEPKEIEVDVIDFLRAAKTANSDVLSLALRDTAGVAHRFYSKEGALVAGKAEYAPRLSIETVIEAESFSAQSGIQVETNGDGSKSVGYIENGDYIVFNGVNFKSGSNSVCFKVASNGAGGNIEIRLGSVTGTKIGTLTVPNTGGWQTWQTLETPITPTEGTQDVYLVFTGGTGYLFNVDWWYIYSEAPVYDIDTSPNEITFAEVEKGYAARTPRTITVTNIGNQPTGTLNIALSGPNANRFTLSRTSLDSLAASNATGTFTVVPNNGLSEGKYTAVITVSGGNGISKTVNVNFTVLAASRFSVTVVNGTVFGSTSGLFEAGEVIEIIADAPADNKLFDKWEIIPADIEFVNNTSTTDASVSFYMPGQAVTATATYAVRKKPAPTAPDAPTLLAKTHNSITLTPNPLYEFSKDGTNWQTSNVFGNLEANTAYTFYQRIAETADTEASAASSVRNESTNAAPTYLVTVSGGTGGGNFAEGTTVHIQATAPEGQRFASWTVNFGGVTISNNPSASFTMPANAVTVTANFEPIPSADYAITVTHTGNGNANANVQSAAQGATITLTATANSGNQFIRWEIISGGVTLSSETTETATFTMPNNAVEVRAVFEPMQQTTPEITNVTPSGNSITITFTPPEQSAILIIGVYDTSGRLLRFVINPITGDEMTVSTSLYGAHKVKTMIWNDWITMIPLCPAVTMIESGGSWVRENAPQ